MRKSFVSSVAAAATTKRKVQNIEKNGPCCGVNGISFSHDEGAPQKNSSQETSNSERGKTCSIHSAFRTSAAAAGPSEQNVLPEESILPESATSSSVTNLGRVESGGLFAAIALVNMQCKRIRSAFASMLPFVQGCIAPADLAETALETNEKLMGQHTSSGQQSCQNSQTVQNSSAGAWEIVEHLGHIYASFSDATWFFLGCNAAQLWRRLLRRSSVPVAPRAHVAQILDADDCVEGCFIIDKISRLATGTPVVSSIYTPLTLLKTFTALMNMSGYLLGGVESLGRMHSATNHVLNHCVFRFNDAL